MALTSGTKLGPYEIVAPLGAGGMGEVYRARDTKLGRDVALKLLPPLFAADADRVERFEREARVLASLNDRHIGAIYGFEDAGTIPALVLELVEGDTLHDRVRRGTLPLSEALAVAQQIAEALDAAHRAGIIHRDLKPSNIKITPDGVVKVLDFGLAKALAAEGSGPDLSKSPTMTADGTIAGVILGTAAYMSPEQARGQPVDKRTDIWAFGCVLFEMLTGSAAFARETITDTIVAVVGAEPEWKALPADAPGGIRRLLTRCLQKDARRRLHDIADARIEIEDAMAMPAEPAPVPPRRWFRPALVALSLAIATALVFLWAVRARFGRPTAEPSPTDMRVIRLTDLPGLEESPAYQEPCRVAFGRSPRLAACHGGPSTASGVLTSTPQTGGLRSSGWPRKASSWAPRQRTVRGSTWLRSSRPPLITCILAGRRTANGLPFSEETTSGSTFSWRPQRVENRVS